MNTSSKWMNPTQLDTAVYITYENMSPKGETISFPVKTEQFLKERVFNNILAELTNHSPTVTEIKAVIGTSDTTDQPHS